MKAKIFFTRFWLVVLMLIIGGSTLQFASPVYADGFITFENGVDGQVIQSTIPGLQFTTTDGYDWIYGDWRTGDYNGKYPDGEYTSNGNFFAWLGANQGDGRIDFTQGGATYLSVWVSTAEALVMTAYYSDGQIAATARLDTPNVNTGRLDNLTVTAPPGDIFQYVVISGIANRWLIDDLSTDASGVPNTRNPLVFVPGVAGSLLENDPDGNNTYDEVWLNLPALATSGDDNHLLVLRLASNGIDPLTNDSAYTSIRVGDIIRTAAIEDVYESTVKYFTQNGYVEGQDFFVCPYDWRKNIQEIAAGSLDNTLDKCVNNALSHNPSATKVNILAHSMGGVISRYYISDPVHAQKVQRLVTLGTPYLGAPQTAMGVIDGICFIEPFRVCLTNPATVNKLLQNFPSAYQIAPSDAYFQVYPNGYIRRDRDLNGDGQYDGYLSANSAFGILNMHNSAITQNARAFQQSIAGWNNGQTNGVEVVMMVGDQQGGAVGTIVEYEKRPWYNPFASASIAYRVETTNGDGTVPLRSADMRNLERGVDLTGDVSVFYFGLDHGEIAKDYQVLQLAGDFFESPASMSANQLYLAEMPMETTNDALSTDKEGVITNNKRMFFARATPRTEPLPLNGRFISVEGPVEVEVFDSLGNRVGLVDNAEDIENLIPGASYRILGTTTVIFIPDTATYELKIQGQQIASADVRIQKIISDQLQQTDLYDDLPITEYSIATLSYDPNTAVAGDFELDQDGDGASDISFAPSATLDANESQDITSPKTTIVLEGTKATNGWYVGLVTATLVTSDDSGGTGVAKVEYSLDGGQTVQVYTDTFTFDAESTRILLAKATDRAGNEEAPLASTWIRPIQVFLPLIVRISP